MKKFFENPKMSISNFSTENIITTSGTLAQDAVKDVTADVEGSGVTINTTHVMTW